jgi:hypothetical protein
MLFTPEPAASSVAVSVTVGFVLCQPAALAAGETVAVIVGFTVSVIVKFAFETSKKTLPSASIFTRALLVATCGIVTDSEPSFAVLAASTCGYVCPPSLERLIFTSLVPTGGRFVSATSHVIVCVEPPGYVTAVFGAVTRNGPAVGASSRVTSAALLPPPPMRRSRAVKRKCSDSGRSFTPATPT